MDTKTKAEQMAGFYRAKLPPEQTMIDPVSILMFLSVLIEIIKLLVAWKCPVDKLKNRGILGALTGSRVKRLFRNYLNEHSPDKLDQLDIIVEAFWEGIGATMDEELVKIYTEQGGQP